MYKFLSQEPKYDFSDVMMIPTEKSRFSSRSQINLVCKERGHIPIVSSNMDRVGTPEIYKTLSKYKIITCFTKHVSKYDLIELERNHNLDPRLYILSSGMKEQDLIELNEKINALSNKPRMVCFDVANGYMESFINKVKAFKKLHPYMTVIAGNVVSHHILHDMKEAGVDIVKVGIGSGSVCTTRLKTGVGCPQFSAIADMVGVAKELGIQLMSDGGIKSPGDAAKAFGIGSDYIMIGGMFSGHRECLTKEELDNILKSNLDEKDIKIEFYGSSSKAALQKHYGGTKNYRTSEGKRVLVKYKGELSNTVEDLLGGLRSACTYMNSQNLNELSANARFVFVRHQLNNMFT